MGDYDLNLKLQMKGINTETITRETEKALNSAVKNMAHAVYDEIVQGANETLHSSRQDYIKSLKFDEQSNLYIISIVEPGIHFEDGFKGFSMLPGLLNGPHSQSRTDKKTGESYRFNVIPFRHKPSSKDVSPKQEKFQKGLNHIVKNYMEKVKDPIIFKDRSGRVIGEVVAKAKNIPKGVRFSGMVKTKPAKGGATYTTFRAVSSRATKNFMWKHPGFMPGAKIFDKVADGIDGKINQIIDVIFGA